PPSTLFPYTTLFRSSAFVVDRVERAVEDGIELDEVRGRDLRHSRCGHELEVQALVLEEAFVACDQNGQVVHRVHGRNLGFCSFRSEEHTSELQSPCN